jgi:UDPglucose 6-dehydrogenase
VVGKSTVPVGTAAECARRLAQLAPASGGAELAWNPEFLREGCAVSDTLHPDRIVAGVRSGRAEATLREIYARPLAEGIPFLVTDFATAELVKVAANAFLATKISFINAMPEVCDVAEADVTVLAAALGHDARIGSASLRPGLGFGGGCLPAGADKGPCLDDEREHPSVRCLTAADMALITDRSSMRSHVARSARGGHQR